MIQIPFVDHLKYDSFKQDVKTNNFIDQTVKALFCDSDNNCHLSSTINLCRCLAESYEDEFKAAASDCQTSAVERYR